MICTSWSVGYERFLKLLYMLRNVLYVRQKLLFEGLVSITCILRPYRLYMMNIKENIILIKINVFSPHFHVYNAESSIDRSCA